MKGETYSWQKPENFTRGGDHGSRVVRDRMAKTAVKTKRELLREQGVIYENVVKEDPDWLQIETLVRESLPTHEIYSLERVINPLLTHNFEEKKEELESRQSGQEPNIIFGFRSSFGRDYKNKNRITCREGHVLSKGDYGEGIYFAKHAIYPTYLFRNYRQSPMNQNETVKGRNADGSGSMEIIVSELLLGNSFDYKDETTNYRSIDLKFSQGYDSIQGTERSFGISDAFAYPVFNNIMGKDKGGLLGWTTDIKSPGPRFEASYYAKNPFDIENGRQYVFDNPDKCNPRFILNIRPMVTATKNVGGLILSTMGYPSPSQEVLMFENSKIIAEINGKRVVISAVNNIGFSDTSATGKHFLEFESGFNLTMSNTIGLVSPGWAEQGQGGGSRKTKKRKTKKRKTKKKRRI